MVLAAPPFDNFDIELWTIAADDGGKRLLRFICCTFCHWYCFVPNSAAAASDPVNASNGPDRAAAAAMVAHNSRCSGCVQSARA